MRETDFIGQNQEKWVEFEEILKSDKKDAEKLSRLFIETTDDLSFSRTYYPNRSVRVYLNGIAQQLYQTLYRNRKKDRGAFKRYWTEELPDAMWFARKQLLLSFCIFILGLFIGLLSSYQNPEFVEIILGEQYVEMTENNIKSGDPMAVYASGGQMESFLKITWNNIKVGVFCFLLGLLFSIGSGFIVFTNAIMVGAFLYFFIQRNLFWESFYAIMLHGTLELSMIVLAGAAGLTLGTGLLFPGSYTRKQSFLLSARHGIRIMIGVSAFLVIAGFIEGFATRYTDAPNFIRGTIIFLSLALVVGYFIIYPYRRAKSGLIEKYIEPETIDETKENLVFNTVKKTGQLINESWRSFTADLGTQLIFGVSVATLFCSFIFYYWGEDYRMLFDAGLFNGSYSIVQDFADGFWFWDEANNFFNFIEFPILFPVIALLLAPVLWIGMKAHFSFMKTMANSEPKASPSLSFLNCLVSSFLLIVWFWTSYFSIIFIPFVWPIVFLGLSCAEIEGTSIFKGISKAFALLVGTFGRTLGLFLVQVLVLWCVMSIVSAPLFYFIFQIIGANFAASLPWADRLIYILHTWLMLFSMSMLIPVFIHSAGVLYHSNTEIITAENLKQRITSISFKKRAYGLEKEN
jgi:uncharacterized membrane protein SpoIIM required for sporulation